MGDALAKSMQEENPIAVPKKIEATPPPLMLAPTMSFFPTLGLSEEKPKEDQ
jgi:hypothetical protein